MSTQMDCMTESETGKKRAEWGCKPNNSFWMFRRFNRAMWVFVVPPEALYAWKSHESVNWVGPTLIVPLLSDTHQIKAVYAMFECVCHWIFWVSWNAVKVTHIKYNQRPKQSHNKAIEWRIIGVVSSKKCTYCVIMGYFFIFCSDWHFSVDQ